MYWAMPCSKTLQTLCATPLCVCTQIELDEAMSRILPSKFTRYFYCNSGSEAVENAVKIARAATGRQDIIAFDVSDSSSRHARAPRHVHLTALGLPLLCLYSLLFCIMHALLRRWPGAMHFAASSPLLHA